MGHAKLRLRGFLALLYRQEELEFWRQLLLRVETVGEVDAAQPAIRVDLHAERLDVVRAIRSARKVRQVELDLIPSLVKTHRHSADERLHPRRRLVVGGTEPPTNVLVIKNHDLKREVFLEVLQDHDEE